MLREIKNVKQEPAGGHRRWFESDALELVVWFDRQNGVRGFQLCYDLGEGDRALTWQSGGGFAHNRIDTGDHTPLKNQSPILLPDGHVPWAEITRRFDEQSRELEPELRELVHERLVEQMKARRRTNE